MIYTNKQTNAEKNKINTLKDWLNYLEALPQTINSPAPQRIQEILKRLNYQKNFTMITIAGTNGKGSTAHLLAHYYQKLDLKVGLFTSPHLLNFNERININGQDTSDQEIINAFEQIKSVQNETELKYFDYCYLAALLIFKAHGIDLACIEVGLGGRQDPSNALDADLSIITTIDFDHQAILGSTREAIGFEKAGIMRSNQICLCGDPETPQSIIKYAKEINAKLYYRNQDFKIDASNTHWDLELKQETIKNLEYPKHIPLANAATALASIKLFSKEVNLKIFNNLMQNLKVPGRMQILAKEPLILVDVAHNPQSAKYLAQQIKPSTGKTYALFSAFKDKDLPELIKPISKMIDTWYILELKHPRAANFEQLKSALANNNINDIHQITNLKTQYQDLIKQLKKSDQLIIFGSFALVAEVLTCHNNLK